MEHVPDYLLVVFDEVYYARCIESHANFILVEIGPQAAMLAGERHPRPAL